MTARRVAFTGLQVSSQNKPPGGSDRSWPARWAIGALVLLSLLQLAAVFAVLYNAGYDFRVHYLDAKLQCAERSSDSPTYCRLVVLAPVLLLLSLLPQFIGLGSLINFIRRKVYRQKIPARFHALDYIFWPLAAGLISRLDVFNYSKLPDFAVLPVVLLLFAATVGISLFFYRRLWAWLVKAPVDSRQHTISFFLVGGLIFIFACYALIVSIAAILSNYPPGEVN
ncbi:MAG: hypothetical protein NXI24_23905 [bacterium]|nr:hypothetical protein [bacterium]